MPLFSRLQRHRDALCLSCLAVLALIVFWPLLLGGRAHFFGDLELYFYPLGQFWHRELIQGRIPLWNPYLFGGVSFAGNPQIGLLYPPSALLGLLPVIPALMLGAVLHLWGSAALFFGWLRRGRLQLGAPAALLGAMVWMLGGFLVSKTQFPNMLAALAWVPAVLWSAENLARQPTARRAVILGAVLGLQLLAAHAQISLYTIYFALLYALWVWKTTPQRASFPKLAAFFGGALVLAALLDAGQLLPVVENLRGAARQTLSIETAPRFFLPPWALSNLFAPYFYGNPSRGTWTGLGGGNFWETACYVGIVPFLLALWSFRRAKFWCAVALASLLLALGPVGGLYLAAFTLVPGIARFHDAGRFLLGAAVAFALAAALGAQRLRNGAQTRPLVPFLLLLSALDLGIFARGVYPLRPVSQIAPAPSPLGAPRVDVMLQTQQGRVWYPDRFGGGRLFVRYEDYRFRTPQHDAPWALAAPPNIPLWQRHLQASGYDPIAPRRALARLETLRIAPDTTQFPPDYAARLGADSVRIFSLWRAQPMSATRGLTEIYRSEKRFEGRHFFLYRNDECLPRARYKSQKSGWEAAKITGESANVVAIETPPGARQVELADNDAPSWSAFQNGQKIEIRATQRGFRAVNLEPRAQASRVDFIYAPTSFQLGVFLSLCALSFVVATLTAKTKKPEA